MWRFKSFTYWFNFALIGAGLYLPGLDPVMRKFVTGAGIANIMLREKTQRGK